MKINEDTQRLMEALPLLSAWGLAIEAGQDSSEQYVELMRLHSKFPSTFNAAILIAEGTQKRHLEEDITPFSEDSPLSHPGHRLRRVEFLKKLLVLE